MISRGLVGSVLILLGGLGRAFMPASTPMMRWGWLLDVRGSGWASDLSVVVVVVGLLVVGSQWVHLARLVARVPHGEAHDGEQHAAIGLVRRATLVWSLPLLVAPPLFSRDGWSYAAQGAMARIGISPYEHGPRLLHGPITEAVDPRWLDTTTPYGPLPVWLGEVGAGLTGNPWVLVVGHRLVAVAGLVMLAWAVPRMARWGRVNPALASALVLASPMMLANGVGGLHNDLLMVGLMAVALVLAVERGWAVGAVAAGLAASVKAPAGLICVAVALLTLPVAAAVRERLVRMAAVGAVATGTILVLGVVTGLGFGWVASLSVPGSVDTPLSATNDVGNLLDMLSRVTGTGLGPDTIVDLLRNLGTLAALAVVAWVALRWRTGDRVAAVRAAALIMGVTVVLSPVVHLWYLLWVPPFLACLPLPRLGTAALVAASFFFGLAAPLDGGLDWIYYAILLTGAAVAVGVPLALRRSPQSRERLRRLTAAEWLPA